MKVALCSVALIASASAFAPQVQTTKTTTALNAESSRRQVFATVGAAFIPAIANAAVGESPRFSVFGVFGDGTSYSEGAAYGSDQTVQKVYSPYSVYSEVGKDSLYVKKGDDEYIARKKAIIAESRKRLLNLPGYIERKKWSEVKTELDRYMYETRGAVRGLSNSREQKLAADAFFVAIEKCNLSATLKKQDDCLAAAKASVDALDKFS